MTLRHTFCPSDRSKSKVFQDFGLRPDQNCLLIQEGPSVKHCTSHEGSCLQVTLLPKTGTHSALLLKESKSWHCVSRETLDKFFISGLLILQCYFYQILQSRASVRPEIHSVFMTYFFIYAKHHDMMMFCSRYLNSYAESPLQVPRNIKDPIWLAAFHQRTGIDKELEPNPHCGL